MSKLVTAWAAAPLYADVPDALAVLEHAGIKVGRQRRAVSGMARLRQTPRCRACVRTRSLARRWG